MRVLALVAFFAAAALQQPASLPTISGRVLGASGRAPQDVALYAWVRTGTSSSSSGPPVTIAPDGSFKTRPLAPGTYALAVGPTPGLPMDADVEGGLAIVDLGAAHITDVRITA